MRQLAVDFVSEHMAEHVRFWVSERNETNLGEILKMAFHDVHAAFIRHLLHQHAGEQVRSKKKFPDSQTKFSIGSFVTFKAWCFCVCQDAAYMSAHAEKSCKLGRQETRRRTFTVQT